MEYSEVLKDIVMRSNHKFIYGECFRKRKVLKIFSK